MFLLGLAMVITGVLLLSYGEDKYKKKAIFYGYLLVALSNIFLWKDVFELLIKMSY